MLISGERTQTTSIRVLELLNEHWRNIKTKAWNIDRFVLKWTYNVSKVTAYVTKKAPPCHRWGFLLPSKRVNHYFLRFFSHNLKSSDNTLISNGARNTVSKVSNICNTSLPWIEGPKHYITPNLYHQHRLVLGIDRSRYTNNLTSKSLYKPRHQHFKTK